MGTDDLKWLAELIMGTNHSELSPNSPVFSPLFGSFEGFPPMYINVGTADILEDDSRGVVKKAQDAGVDVTFEEGLHLMHVYPGFFSYFSYMNEKTCNRSRKGKLLIYELNSKTVSYLTMLLLKSKTRLVLHSLLNKIHCQLYVLAAQLTCTSFFKDNLSHDETILNASRQLHKTEIGFYVTSRS